MKKYTRLPPWTAEEIEFQMLRSALLPLFRQTLVSSSGFCQTNKFKQMEKVKLLSVSPKGKFYPELIDTRFSIYSPVTEKFHQPNYYCKFSDGSGHCGSLSYFLDFEISKNESRFFSGNGISIGYLVENPNKLIMLSCSVCDGKKYVKTREYQPEMKFDKEPTTNLEFKMMVEEFLNEIELDFIDMEIDFVQSISSQSELVEMSNQDDGDLPF